MAYYLTMQPQKPPIKNPGEVINGRYTVAQIIGRGATGEVYVVADQEKNNLLLALKYLNMDPGYTPALEHFKSEFETMTHLNHPHIARVFDFEWDNKLSLYFFTSELINGLDFKNSSKQLDIEQTEILLIQALRALEYLHGHGIFHYDIKPQNILVIDANGPSPSVKIIDFGLASTTPPDRLVGTPSYMAPEMIERKKTDGRTDIYSLGVLAYFALTGINPFKGADKEETLQNHLTLTPPAPITINPSVPEYLSSIVMKCIERDPDHRYTTPSEIIRDINFRSPRFHAIETPETLLSYVPWEGPFAGREEQLSLYKNWLSEINTKKIKSVFWVQGNLGTGKSRFAEECKKIAQLLNYNVLHTNETTHKVLGRIEKTTSPALIIIDDFLKQNSLQDAELCDIFKNKNIVMTTSADPTTIGKVRDFLESTNLPFKEILISNFTIKELKEYLCTLTGLKEVPTWLIRSLSTFTSGNPLFLTETMKEIISKGLLFDKAGRWKKSTMEDLGISISYFNVPNSVMEKLKETFQKLSPLQTSLAALLATATQPLKQSDFIHMATKAAPKELKNLVDRNLFNYTPASGEYSYKNAITKQAFYLNLSKEERYECHEKLGKHLFSKKAPPNEINYHIQRSANASTAKRSLLKEISKKDGKVSDELINEFLDRFGENLDDDVFNVLLRKAELQVASRNLKEAHDTYDEIMRRLPPEKTAPRWHFETRIATGYLLIKERKLDEASLQIKEASRVSRLTKDPTTTIIAENYLTCIEYIKGNFDYAIEKYRSSLTKARRLGAKKKDVVTNNDLGLAYFYKGDFSHAMDILKDDVRLFKKVGDIKHLCRTLHALGESYRQLQNYDKAETIFDEIVQRAKEVNDIEMLYRAYNGLGLILNDRGKFSDSIGYFERALDLALHLENHDAAVGLMMNVAIINSNLGNNKKAFDALETTLTFLERKNFPVMMRNSYMVRIHLELGELNRLEKKFDKAARHLNLALKMVNTPQTKAYLFWVLLTQAKLERDMRHLKKADGIIKRAGKLADSAAKKKLLEETKKYTHTTSF